MRYLTRIGSKEYSVEVVRRGGGRYAVRLDGEERIVERSGAGALMALSVGGQAIEAAVAREGLPVRGGCEERNYGVTIDGRHYAVEIVDPLRGSGSASSVPREGRFEVRSIMPGRIAAVLVREGETVEAGRGLVVVEAMKMENEIPSPKAGRITALKVRPGEAVEAGALLVTVE